jgi:hypothetical protein
MSDDPENKPPQIIIYETDDKVARVSVRLEDESAWLTNAQLAQLFQVSKSTVSEHIKNIFDSGELLSDSVVRNFRTTATDEKLLVDAGQITHAQAVEKARIEYVNYQARTLSDVEKQYLATLKIIDKTAKKRGKK